MISSPSRGLVKLHPPPNQNVEPRFFGGMAIEAVTKRGGLTANGEALLGLNQFDPALATLREAEETLRRLSELDPAATSHRWDLSGVYRLAAEAHSGQGEKKPRRSRTQRRRSRSCTGS